MTTYDYINTWLCMGELTAHDKNTFDGDSCSGGCELQSIIIATNMQ